MIRKIFAPLLVLIVANILGGTFVYYVYFPWVFDIGEKEVKDNITSDARELNFRLSILDYNHSPQTIARAEYELETKITSEKLSDLNLDKNIKDELKQNRYLVYMNGEDGPIGLVILNDNESILKLGPYDAPYFYVTVRDWLVYAFVLLLLNGSILYGLYYLNQRNLRPASYALDKVQFDGLALNRQNYAVQDLATNIPKLVEHINDLRKEHQQSLYNQRDLMHAVAHEFRGPMARLSFALDLFNDKTSDARKEKLTTDMHDALDELDALVREVLGYSRLKHGQHPLQLSEFNIKELTEDVCDKVKTIHNNKQFVIYSQPNQGSMLYADKNLIERALINLVRNAARFSISTVQINLTQYNESIDIQVEDDGPGIPPGKRKRIFEPFTRLDFSRNRDSGGAGLGLAIAKGIISRHHGKIWAEDSRVLNGALFTISMPLKQLDNAVSKDQNQESDV
ncbi:sensor histidine kinase [Kangiella koreensis]|uniref:histidine kinase n=1 Tax=Kangiella koreensis (strain DSM 16069 / JCM 12317 / KCTC 12182 / SW-125) TaxID=523791 RepID=C7RCP4_KANKD|nr:ATP-binding protein [Kangiella koreensis]ACV27036.1 histidine kinase [Kangiella koreensis DSM 16069]